MKSTLIERTLKCRLLLLGVMGLMASNSLWAQEQSWSYTYNDQGLVTSEDGPRTDVNDITTHTYDSQGNRLSTTNALGHVTTYNDYDASGRVLSVTGSNGLTTELAYHPRGWLTRSTIQTPEGSDRVTEYDYDAVGQLVGMTLPNGATMHFEYDAARRLVAVSNGQGERIEYTLDAAGNRTQKTILDSAGTLRYSVSRAYDGLSRVMDILGNNDQHEHRDYDVNDNPTAITDGRSHTTEQQYDALDRVSQVIDPALGETRYTYNSQDQISSVTDPKGLTTHYRYDGLGNLVEVTSPDTGTTTHEYDAAGNRTRTTDARGVVSEYRYDALNRLVAIHYPDQPEYDVQYHYDETDNGNHGIGRLTGLTDASGHTAYRYDVLGQVVEKQTTVEGLTLTVQYQYNTMGQVSGITYPSGRQVQVDRDPQGRPDRILAQPTPGATLQPLMEQARYLPFGPIEEYTYGNGLVHQRSYDRDYRLTQLDVGSSNPVLSRLYEYDPVNNITGIHNAQASDESQNFTYDSLDRLTDALSQEGLLSYRYDPVGNRTEHYRDGDIETYLYGPDSHRLDARDNTQYQYDATGNTLDNGQYRFHYSASNRLIEVRDHSGDDLIAEYRHNALGQRVLKRAGQATPDHLALAQEEVAKAEQHRQAAQDSQAQAEFLLDQAEHQHAEGSTLSTQAALMREQADTERAQAEQQASQAEQLEEAAAQLTDEAADLRARIVERPSSFWDRLRNAAYAAAADAADEVSQQLSAEAATHRTDAEQRLASADELEQQAQDLEAQAESLLAAAQTAETDANSLGQQAADQLTQADAAEAQAQEYRQLAEGATQTDAQQTVYLYNETGQLIGEYDDTGAAIREYIYRDTAPLALAVNDQIYYYHNDHLATPKLLTDANQNIVWQAKHTLFGKAEVQAEQVNNNLRFPGQYFDEEAGLHYNYFRDYDPETGRYLQSDPIGLEDGINTYAYVGGNPITFVDPLGLARWEGRVEYVAAGVIAGYVGAQYILESECIDGVKWKVWVKARGAGTVYSSGAWGAAASTITFDDGMDGLDPSIFEGSFVFAGGGFSTPIGGVGAGVTLLGSAASKNDIGYSVGIELPGYYDVHGSSGLVSAKKESCEFG